MSTQMKDGSVMFWEAFSISRKSQAVVLHGIQNSQQYKVVLDDILLFFYESKQSEDDFAARFLSVHSAQVREEGFQTVVSRLRTGLRSLQT